MRVLLLYADGLCEDWPPWLVTVSCCSCGNAKELPHEEGKTTVRLQSWSVSCWSCWKAVELLHSGGNEPYTEVFHIVRLTNLGRPWPHNGGRVPVERWQYQFFISVYLSCITSQHKAECFTKQQTLLMRCQRPTTSRDYKTSTKIDLAQRA